jgi:hypothetical protein
LSSAEPLEKKTGEMAERVETDLKSYLIEFE